MSPPSAYCNIDTTQEEEEDEEEEEIVNDKCLDPTWCEDMELHSSREGIEEEEDVSEQHPSGTGSRASKTKRAPMPTPRTSATWASLKPHMMRKL